MDQQEQAKTSTQPMSSPYFFYHKDSLSFWLNLEFNQDHFIQKTQLLKELFSSNKNVQIQIKKGGGKSLLMDYIVCLAKPGMIEERHINQIPHQISKLLKGIDILYIKFSKRVAFSEEKQDEAFHDFFREDMERAFQACIGQYKNIKRNEDEEKLFNQLQTSELSIGDYFIKYFSFLRKLNNKQKDILILIDDFDVILTASKCYFGQEQYQRLTEDIKKILAAAEAQNIRILLTCTQRIDFLIGLSNWEYIYDLDQMELFHSKLDQFDELPGEGRTRNYSKQQQENKQQYHDECGFIILRHASELAEKTINPGYKPQFDYQIKLHSFERRAICITLHESKEEGLATLDKLLKASKVDTVQEQSTKECVQILVMLRNYGLIYQSDLNLFRLHKEHKNLIDDIKNFIGLFQHVDIFKLMEQCTKLVRSIPNDDQFIIQLNDIVQMKKGQWTQQTATEADFEVLVSGIISICGGEILILSQQETFHRKRLDAIIFRDYQGDSTYIVLINEYKIKKGKESYDQKTVDQAIFQIIANNYVEIGLKLCETHEIDNSIFKLKALVLHISDSQDLLVTQKNVCIGQKSVESLYQFVENSLIKYKDLKNIEQMPEIREKILEEYLPEEIVNLTKSKECAHIQIKILVENLDYLIQRKNKSIRKREDKIVIKDLIIRVQDLINEIKKKK